MFPQGGWGDRAPAPTGQAPHMAILGKGSHGEIRVQVRGYHTSLQLLIGAAFLYAVFVLKLAAFPVFEKQLYNYN